MDGQTDEDASMQQNWERRNLMRRKFCFSAKFYSSTMNFPPMRYDVGIDFRCKTAAFETTVFFRISVLPTFCPSVPLPSLRLPVLSPFLPVLPPILSVISSFYPVYPVFEYKCVFLKFHRFGPLERIQAPHTRKAWALWYVQDNRSFIFQSYLIFKF